MYSNAFCKVYNEFGWNYFPEAFAEQLLIWLEENHITVKTSMDLACGTGILCEKLSSAGIDASGMDFSQGMIDIARESDPSIHYDVADMILYRPDKAFDLVTCTGDALNHIIDITDLEKIFQNVYAYTKKGGYFIFDLLNENEISTDEPFDLDFSDTVHARFQMTRGIRDQKQIVQLHITVYENDVLKFEEVITETVHDKDTVCEMLTRAGFQLIGCSHHLSSQAAGEATTWYIIARK